jgi:diguanylate cyclase (GGDEF)-like protein
MLAGEPGALLPAGEGAWPVRTTRRRRERNRDHYYWLTAFLAARGAQTATCRVVAAMMVGVGAIPLLLSASPVGPDGLRSRIVATVAAVCCLVMAAVWLRNRWPTRIASQLCVVTGSICIAVTCLIQPDPVVGLLGSTAFAILGGFIALFHSLRLLTFMWLVASTTLVVLAARVAAIDSVLAVCGVLLVALVNVFAVFGCRTLLRLINAEVLLGDIEPLTGLLTRDAFPEKVATLMNSRGRGGDRYLVVAVVNLDNFSLLQDTAGVSAAKQVRVAVGQLLRETVRGGAVIAHAAEAEYFIADVFTSDDPSPLAERVRGTIASSPRRLTASIGVVSTALSPLAGHPAEDVLNELLSIATAAMYQARRAGGNRAHQVRSPALTVLDRPDGGIWSADESA